MNEDRELRITLSRNEALFLDDIEEEKDLDF